MKCGDAQYYAWGVAGNISLPFPIFGIVTRCRTARRHRLDAGCDFVAG